MIKDISFFNVTGCSVGVIYKDSTFIAHISEPFPDEPFTFEWNEVNATKAIRKEYDESEIVVAFYAERKRVNAETRTKMEEGWTQWVNMEDEAANRYGKLMEQLEKYGLHIVFEKTEGTDFEWFKIVKK